VHRSSTGFIRRPQGPRGSALEKQCQLNGQDKGTDDGRKAKEHAGQDKAIDNGRRDLQKRARTRRARESDERRTKGARTCFNGEASFFSVQKATLDSGKGAALEARPSLMSGVCMWQKGRFGGPKLAI